MELTRVDASNSRPKTLREEIRNRSRMSRMRMGQEAADYVTIPSMGDVRVALVPVTEAELTAGLAYAAMSDDIPETFSGAQYRSRRAIQSDLWHSIRDPGDISLRVFTSIEDMIGEDGIDPSDIDYLNMHLAALMNYASPAIDGLTLEQMDFLDEHWKEIRPSELTGREWAAAKVSLSILLPGALQGRFFGSSSTESSTPSGDEAEPTSDA